MFTDSINGIFERKVKYSIKCIPKKKLLFNFLTILYVHASLFDEYSPIVISEVINEIINEICNPLKYNFENTDIKGNEYLFPLNYYCNDDA